MNRRNFILGLGTAATLSGAASVTSAAFSGSTSPGADFRVISDEQLNVRRSSGLEISNNNVSNDQVSTASSNTGYVNESNEFVDVEGNITYSSLDSANADGPAVTLNSSGSATNSDLNMSLVAPNTNDTDGNRNVSLGGDAYFTNSTNASSSNGNLSAGEPLLEVENLGSSATDVGVTYNYGDDANQSSGSSTLGYADVHQLFRFIDIDGGNQTSATVISPSPSDDSNADPAGYMTVPSGETRLVGLELNYSDALAQKIADTQGFSGSFGSGGAAANADLLDSVNFGVNN